MSKKAIAIIVAVVAAIALVIAGAFLLGQHDSTVAELGAIEAPEGNDDANQDEDAGNSGAQETDDSTLVESPKLDSGGDIDATTLQFSGVELLESYGFTQTDVNELAVDVTDLLEADGDDPEMKFGVMNGTSTDADGNTVAYLQAIALGDRYYAVTLDKDGTEGGRVSVSRVTDNSTLPDFADTGRSE